jgi:DNA-binding MurR/RpiR family transcriptional regulator
MNAYQQIEMHVSELSPREMVVYDIVRNEPQAIVQSTTTELSSAFVISQSSLSRFSRKCGFPSFSDMRMKLFQALSDDARVANGTQEGTFDAADLLCDLVRTTREVADDETLDHLADIILGARHVYTSGLGMSSIPANLLAMQLLSQTVPISFIDPSMAWDYLKISQAGDAYIVFSSSGKSTHVYPHVIDTPVDDHHPRTVLVTHSARPLPPSAIDEVVVLPTWSREHYPYFAETTTSMLVFCDLLTAWIARRVEAQSGVGIDS